MCFSGSMPGISARITSVPPSAYSSSRNKSFSLSVGAGPQPLWETPLRNNRFGPLRDHPHLPRPDAGAVVRCSQPRAAHSSTADNKASRHDIWIGTGNGLSR